MGACPASGLVTWLLFLVAVDLARGQSVVPGMTSACVSGLNDMEPIMAPVLAVYSESNMGCFASCSPASNSSCGAECTDNLMQLQDTCHGASGLIYQVRRSVLLAGFNEQLLLSYTCFPTVCASADVDDWSAYATNSTCSQYYTYPWVVGCVLAAVPDDAVPTSNPGAIVAGVIVTLVFLVFIGYVGYLVVKWRAEHRVALLETLPMLGKKPGSLVENYHRRQRYYAATPRERAIEGSLSNLQALEAVIALRSHRGVPTPTSSINGSYDSSTTSITSSNARPQSQLRYSIGKTGEPAPAYFRLAATHGGMLPSLTQAEAVARRAQLQPTDEEPGRRNTLADQLITNADNSIL